MARKQEPKCKQCRREGEKLYLKGDRCFTAKCAIVRRSYKPGVHGPNSKTRPTQFGLQLREKQKAKNIYGIKEQQFENYFIKATRQKGNTGDNLVTLLEMRLDNVVYRLGFGKSRSLARQLVSHGHINVNGKRVTVASYHTKTGDIVTLRPSIQKSKLFENDAPRMEKHQAPGWVNVDAAAMTGKILNAPVGKDLHQNFDPKRIVEFYSR